VYPKLTPETEVEVKLADGRSWRVTFGAAMRWANRVAEQQAVKWKTA